MDLPPWLAPVEAPWPENAQCPVDIVSARSWVCIACGRGRGRLAEEEPGDDADGQ